MKVYVLDIGTYSNRHDVGVYSDLEKAKAAWQPKKPDPPPQLTVPNDTFTGRVIVHTYTYQWVLTEGYWNFDADWGDAASITEFELDAPANA